MIHLENRYYAACTTPGNIHEHLPTLRRLAAESRTVVEFGVNQAVSTVALLAAQPERLTSYDLRPSPEAEALREVSGRTEFEFVLADSLTVDPVDCDMLFVDSLHTEAQLSAELARHAPGVARIIALHDIVAFGERGEDGGPGLLPAIAGFLSREREWSISEIFVNNNGLMVLRRSNR